MKKVIPVVFATSKSYFPMAMVAMQSLINHTCAENNYEIFLFHTELTAEDAVCAQQMAKKNVSITLMNVAETVKEYIEDGLFFDSDREYNTSLSKVTFYQLLIPTLLPQFDKIIYLECDITVREDIEKLYGFDVGEYLFAGVPIEPQIGRKEPYIHGGIILLNGKRWREEQHLSLCMDTLKKWIGMDLKKIPVPDELILNVTGRGRILYLPASWNAAVGQLVISHSKLFMDNIEKSGIEQLNILHYTKKVHNDIVCALASDFWRIAETISLPSGDTVKDHYFKPLLEKEMEKTKHQELSQIKWREFLQLYSKNQTLPLCFYGAGKDGKRMLSSFQDINWKLPLFFVDKKEALHGTVQHGLQVTSLETALQEYPDLIILITTRDYQGEIYQELIQKLPENQVFFPTWLGELIYKLPFLDRKED